MLWLDGHASSNTDEVTPTLFDVDVIRLGRSKGTRCFEDLVLLPDRYLLYCKQKLTACNVTEFGDLRDEAALGFWLFKCVVNSTNYPTAWPSRASGPATFVPEA